MPVSSVTEHWIKQDAITINLNHFGDPDYLQVSVLAGAVVMAFKQDIIGYNAAHNYRTWPLQAANTYLEKASAVNVYARLTRSEVNASALIIYDPVLRDIEGRAISYAEDGSEIFGEVDSAYFYIFLGQISESINSNGEQISREWEISFRFGSLDTSQYRNEEAGGEWQKMFRLNKVTDMIDVLKTFSSAVFKRLFVGEKEINDVQRSSDEGITPRIDDTTIPTTKFLEGRYLSKQKDDETPYNLGVGKNLTVGQDVIAGKDVIVGESTHSKDFVSGFVGGKGWAIRLKEFLNAAGITEKKSVAEFDDVIVRGSLRVYEFIVSQLLGENDNRIFTGMMEVDHYDATDGKVYLKTDNGRLYNPFRADDVIIVQQYGGNPSEENGYYVTKQYEFIVTEVGIGNTEDGEDRLDWLTFRSFSTPMEGGSEALITERDTLVRIDNLSDANRKGVIQLMSVGEDTPYMDFIYGAKTDPENSLKGRLGNLGGVYNPLFGWLKEFGAYLTNLYAVGEFVIAHTGEDVSDTISIAKGQFRTNFRQTTYDMSEEQNFFTNAAMTNNCEHWILGSDVTEYFLVDDLPQFFNYELYASESSYAGIAEWKGRDMLRLSESTLRQSNDLIRKAGTHKVHTGTTENEDGSYTDVYEDVPDKLYLSVRLYVATSGKVELGFVDTEGNFIDNDFRYSEELTAREDGYEVKLSGIWDGNGDFFITSTGDVYIDLLSLTDKPLENFKITTETAIEQTAQAISLLGSKLNGTDGTVTKLALTVDAMGESISSLVTKTNSITNTINTSGWINSSDAVNIFSQQVTAQGIAKTADIKVYVDNKISGIKLTADQITIDGVTSVNKTFKIGKNGYMTCIGGTIGGFTINENTLTASTSINMVLSAEDSSGYPSIGWFGSGSTAYSSLGVAIHENYLGGQLYLSNVNQQQALVMPSGIILQGSKQIVQLNTGVQNVSTGTLLPAIQIRSKQYTTVTASLGFRGSRISFYVPDLPTEVNAQAGEVYVDGNNNLKLKK